MKRFNKHMTTVLTIVLALSIGFAAGLQTKKTPVVEEVVLTECPEAPTVIYQTDSEELIALREEVIDLEHRLEIERLTHRFELSTQAGRLHRLHQEELEEYKQLLHEYETYITYFESYVEMEHDLELQQIIHEYEMELAKRAQK